MSSSNVASAQEEGRKHHSSSSNLDEKPVAQNPDPVVKNLTLLFCFLGLQFSYVIWGIIQERVMTQEYKHGRFKSSTFCVFMNRFLALFISLAIVLYQRYTSTKTIKEAPFLHYAPASLSNSISSWAQYEALKFVSFPAQVLSKSCKIIPVMIVGIFVNRKSYPAVEYVEALLITSGVTMFTLSEKKAPTEQHDDTLWGCMLLILYLTCDSFTSQWQSRVYKSHGVNQYQMMLGVNIWSMLMTGFTLIQSGVALGTFAIVFNDSTLLMHMIVLSISSAVGQLFIYYTIKEFGAVVFTIIMTTRQMISLVVSCVLFSHPLSPMSWIGSVLVFIIVFNRIRRKGQD
mmetsp:Transcript_26555/g.26802  ORF Transcript_26555/g.26802 Transcript_26555/m.26802 type:complete len:344 (-) Transcript_26555:206-1237(-)